MLSQLCEIVLIVYSKGKVRKVQPGGTGEFKKQSIKYTAQKLHEKGVILEIEGLPSHQYVQNWFPLTINLHVVSCYHAGSKMQCLKSLPRT